jgi:hypothetical protein
MKMQERAERRRFEEFLEVIGASETGEENSGHRDRYAGVENAVALPDRKLCGCQQILASVQ